MNSVPEGERTAFTSPSWAISIFNCWRIMSYRRIQPRCWYFDGSFSASHVGSCGATEVPQLQTECLLTVSNLSCAWCSAACHGTSDPMRCLEKDEAKAKCPLRWTEIRSLDVSVVARWTVECLAAATRATDVNSVDVLDNGK
ncbi:Protein wech [Trichinella spiralis]|uniref:Protein wech n=1 Tax=Trichinella spiralis TaxID=6334 RepID=A0ABR3K8W3_TRISP